MLRRNFLKNAAGLYVAAQSGIEIGWRRKFFPGANFHDVKIVDAMNRVLASGYYGEPFDVDVTGTAYRVIHSQGIVQLFWPPAPLFTAETITVIAPEIIFE